MGAGHSHGPSPNLDLSRAARLGSIGLLVAVAVATVIGVVLLWPAARPELSAAGTGSGTAQSVAPIVQGRITELVACPDQMDAEPSGSIQHACQLATVQVTSGDDVGQSVPVELIGVSAVSGAVVGDPVHVTNIGMDGQDYWALVTLDRLLPLGLFTLVFIAVVIAVAGWKGVRGLIGLAVAGAIFFGFMLPALATGRPAVAVALVGGSAIMFAVLYLAHGISMRTTSAFVGTLVSLLATAGLGALGVRAGVRAQRLLPAT